MLWNKKGGTNRIYYAQHNGTVSLNPTPFPLGPAVSTTEIFMIHYKGYNQ